MQEVNVFIPQNCETRSRFFALFALFVSALNHDETQCTILSTLFLRWLFFILFVFILILVLGMWPMARVHRSILRRFAEAEAEDWQWQWELGKLYKQHKIIVEKS
jgi:hypothetical protein